MPEMVWVPFFNPDRNEYQYKPWLAEKRSAQAEAPPEHQRITNWRELLAEQEAARL